MAVEDFVSQGGSASLGVPPDNRTALSLPPPSSEGLTEKPLKDRKDRPALLRASTERMQHSVGEGSTAIPPPSSSSASFCAPDDPKQALQSLRAVPESSKAAKTRLKVAVLERRAEQRYAILQGDASAKERSARKDIKIVVDSKRYRVATAPSQNEDATVRVTGGTSKREHEMQADVLKDAGVVFRNSRVPSASPLTGEPVPPHYIHACSAHFRDTSGRALLLRGVNFSGSAKAPVGQPSEQFEGFWEKAEGGGESFVGQPLDLEDGSADVHLQRLRAWGFNCLRWVVTWESLEHEGPDKYDEAYIDYTIAALRKVKEYGFKVFIDPHQDLFSRFTGGSGAPFWTVIACGLNPRNFTATQAAFLHCEWPGQEDPDPYNFPDMLWATNYNRLAAMTMSVLFFAGKAYAPKCIIDGMNIQDYLQRHFLRAFKHLAERLRDAGDLFDECIIGWDNMNEPNRTLVGIQDLSVIPKEQMLKKGPTPTPLQAMQLGMGKAVTVENWVFGSLGPKRGGHVTVDPAGKTAWLAPETEPGGRNERWSWTRDPGWKLGKCVWALHDVWDVETGDVLEKDYFRFYRLGDGLDDSAGSLEKRQVDFVADFWLPHWRAYASTVRPVHKEAIMFVQPPVFEPPPKELSEADLQSRAALSPHFYDGLTLITKHWNWFNADALGLLRRKYPGVLFAVKVGNAAIRQCLREQLAILRQDTLDVLGRYPTMVGEIGIPYDLDNKKAYFGSDGKGGKGAGDYTAQCRAMDASLNACDGRNVLNYCVWTYCPDNSHKWGDHWNGEDLSIWSADDVKERKGSSPHFLQQPEGEKSLAESADTIAAPSPLSATSPAGDKLGNGASAHLTDKTYSSTASLVTLADPTNLAAPHLTEYTIPFLTNGSRAAAAFCRPYPTATVGTPLSIDFDIKSSEFKFSLSVTPNDVQDEGLPTEIYVPFVHYASDVYLGDAAGHCGGNPIRAGTEDVERDVGKELSKQSTTAESLGLPLSEGRYDDAFQLDLHVEVTAGRWEVQGQRLLWYLPPNACERGRGLDDDDTGDMEDGPFIEAGDGEAVQTDLTGQGKYHGGETTHTIIVRRKSGPISFEENLGAWDALYERAFELCNLL